MESDFLRAQIRWNKRLYPGSKPDPKAPPVLIELNNFSSLFAFALVSNVLAEGSASRIVPYVANPSRPRWIGDRLYRFLLHAFFAANLFKRPLLYKSFGATSSPLVPFRSLQLRREASEIVAHFFDNTPSKRKLENFRVRDVLVGDLLYDTFLRQEDIPTIDLEDCRFRRFFEIVVADSLFWDQTFLTRPIKAVIASHGCFNYAIPLRFALKHGVPAFATGETFLYRLSDERPFTHMEILDFPEIFARLTPETRAQALSDGDKLLQKRFAGKVYPGADISYTSLNSYRAPETKKRILLESEVPKVLIAPHAFSDGPHGRGNALFPDFWEWLEFLGKKSTEGKYEWYIKNHPDVFRGDRPIIDGFIRRFPSFTLLPDEVTHHQIIEEGISAVVTVHGTIGFEYALQGIPVINSSAVNPHIRYSFNHHPQSVGEFEALLDGIERLPRPSPEDLQLAREYFALKNFLADRRFLLTGLTLPTRPAAEGYRPKTHDTDILNDKRRTLVEGLSEVRQNEILAEIREFVASEDYSIALADLAR